MTGVRRKRLERLAGRIAAQPLDPRVVRAAFGEFRATGTLPENDRLAATVIAHAEDFLISLGCVWRLKGAEAVSERVMGLCRDGGAAGGGAEELRTSLFGEALYGDPLVKFGARQAIKALVACGREVTDPEFVPAEVDIPDWGTVGLHLLGFPGCLVRPEDRAQMRDLMARFDAIRGQVDQGDREWFAELEVAVRRNQRDGELPRDELLRGAVVAAEELRALAPC